MRNIPLKDRQKSVEVKFEGKFVQKPSPSKAHILYLENLKKHAK